MQEADWALEKVPAGQVLHSLEPSTDEYLPGAQDMQASAPASSAKVPLGLQGGEGPRHGRESVNLKSRHMYTAGGA